MITTTCPECQRPINLYSTPEIGQQLLCVNCNNTFEVTWLFPLILDYLENGTKITSNLDEELE